MNLTRSLSIEVNRGCDMGHIHGQCPNMHPDRFKYSNSKVPLTDEVIWEFWMWARYNKYFRGVVNWSNYSEPTMALGRIRLLMAKMKQLDPGQPFQIVTNREDGNYEQEFDIVKRSRYRQQIRLCDDGKPEFDNRHLVTQGEGKPYSKMIPYGHCVRGLGWEIIIGFHGEWHLCCADWTCEESVGSIMVDDWEDLYLAWKEKASRIRWHDEASYNALPRLCRCCLDVNPSLHFREDIDLIRRLPPQSHKDFGVELL